MAKRGAHATQNSFHWLCSEYMASTKFRSLALNSQKSYSAQLHFAARVLGSALLKATTKTQEDQVMRPKIVNDYVWALVKEGKPQKARAALGALRALSKWAIVSEYITHDITFGVEGPKISGGHIPWTDEQVALAVQYARPDLGRAVLLGARTGQRRSDLIKMCWTDITVAGGRQGIQVTQKKTGLRLWIPVDGVLATALLTWERRPGKILLTDHGKEWTEQKISDAWRNEVKRNPHLYALHGLVLHGLRGHACVRLYRSGCTTREVAQMVGMSEMQVAGYTKLSSNQDNNLATIYRLENFKPQKKDSA